MYKNVESCPYVDKIYILVFHNNNRLFFLWQFYSGEYL